MQEDFHYYATYCAAFLAGYSHEESLTIAYNDQLVDMCSKTVLKKVGGPVASATTQLQGELVEAKTDILGLQDITRIWASFHFLPYDLHAPIKAVSKAYKDKYRLICHPNGALVAETVNTAKGRGLEAAGLAMHVLADTWAHSNFIGTPSYVINNTDYNFYEILMEGDTEIQRKITFRHSATGADQPDKSLYTNSISNGVENSIMNLGHGRAGHLPDYSFVKYKYLPAWGNYNYVVKDNPSDYIHAFCQVIYALQYLRGDRESFELDTYDWDIIEPYREEIMAILTRRQLNACADWKAFGEKLSGQEIPDFDLNATLEEYQQAGRGRKDNDRNDTSFGRFTLAAMRQKSMVTKYIFESGNLLAGFSKDYTKTGFVGIRDFKALIENSLKE